MVFFVLERGATMHDLLNEPRMSLADLAQQEDVNCCTVWRWANRGVKGIRLETFSRGGRRFTTLPAFARWCERVTAATTGQPTTSRSRRQEEADVRRAEKELTEAGI
jgi:Protein of unknown function (DUF1580)